MPATYARPPLGKYRVLERNIMSVAFVVLVPLLRAPLPIAASAEKCVAAAQHMPDTQQEQHGHGHGHGRHGAVHGHRHRHATLPGWLSWVQSSETKTKRRPRRRWRRIGGGDRGLATAKVMAAFAARCAEACLRP
jgi:hypothetical protein